MEITAALPLERCWTPLPWKKQPPNPVLLHSQATPKVFSLLSLRSLACPHFQIAASQLARCKLLCELGKDLLRESHPPQLKAFGRSFARRFVWLVFRGSEVVYIACRSEASCRGQCVFVTIRIGLKLQLSLLLIESFSGPNQEKAWCSH